jgi:chromosome segregation ATPase
MPGPSSPSPAREDVSTLARTVDDLNNRLQLVLLAHREQGNISSHAGRAREETLAALEQQIEETRIAYSRQLEDVIKARDTERQAKLILESQLADLRRKLDALKKSFDAEEGKIQGLENMLVNTQEELAEKNALVLQLKSSNENLLMQVGNLKKKLQSLEAQLAEALKGADQNVDELNFWKAKAQTAEQTYSTLQEEHLSTINRLEKEILLLRGTGEGMETRLRTEFARQMSEIVRERQLIYDQEKSQLLEDQRQLYEDKIRSLRSSFNERSDEVNAIIARSQELETVNKVLSERVDENDETIRALSATVEHQKTLLEELRNKPMFAMTKKDQEIRELRGMLHFFFTVD